MSEQININTTSHQSSLKACAACHRVFQVPVHWPVIACPVCQQAQLIPVTTGGNPPAIELILKPNLNPENLHDRLTQFCKGTPFAVPDLNPENLMNRILLLYWPMWLTDADLNGEWDAVFGYEYQVESTREQMGGSGWSSQKVIKTRIKEEPRKGFINRHYDSLISPALHTHQERLSQIGAYDINTMSAFQGGVFGQNIIEVNTLWPKDLDDFVKQELSKLASRDAQKAADAQHPKTFTYYGEFNNFHWTQAIMPIFTCFYEDEKGTRQAIAVNGQTGQVYGRRMASMKKAWLLTGILLVIATIIMLVLYFIIKDFSLCAASAFILAFIPAIRASTWNSKEKTKPPMA